MSAVSTFTDLKTLLKLALPVGSRLVTGHADTPVNWVTHLRTRPPIFAEIEGYELVLVSTSTLANYHKPLALETVIEELTRLKAGALGVRGTISPRAVQMARQANFPLIALPERAVLPQVERAVQRLLTNPQSQYAHRAFELEQTLQRHAASYRGLTTMLTALARLLDRAAVIHDRRGHVVGRGLPASGGADWETHPAFANGPSFVRRIPLTMTTGAATGTPDGDGEDAVPLHEGHAALSALLRHDDQVAGYVSLLHDGDLTDDFDRLALQQCVPLLAREFARQQSNETTIETLPVQRDWITEWLTSPAADDALLTLRAQKDSYQPGLWYAAALFQWLPANDRTTGTFSAERMVKVVRGELRQRRIQAPVGHYAERLVLFFPLEEPQQTQRLKQMIDLLHTQLAQAAPDGEITVGVGRPVQGLTALRDSFSEAERALTLPEQLWEEESVAFFGDLSLYELLLGVGDQRMLKRFCDHWLAPLREYDDQHHTDLLPTLAAYFANNGNMARTAHLLNIHRNTLVYRLGRITEIIQLDMDDSNVRLNLHLALKIQRMVDASHCAGHR